MPGIPKNVENAINNFIENINKTIGERVKKIILYGSYARGDYRDNSDLDIMILTDFTEEEIVKIRTKIWDLAYDTGLDNNITISVLLKNIDEYNYWLDTLPFYMNVQKEGVVLNG